MREIKLKAKNAQGTIIEVDARNLFDRVYDKIDPETVALSTGAKDADGVEIYEGDIVKYSEFENEPPTVGVVYFDTEEYQYWTDFGDDGAYPFSFDGLEPGYLQHATPDEVEEYERKRLDDELMEALELDPKKVKRILS